MFWSRYSEQGRAGTVDVAFSDRHGGVSAPPFESLDLGGAGPSGGHDHQANLALLADAFAVSGLTLMRQVHGRDVTIVGSSTLGRPTCDALVTDAFSVALCVRVADCVPIVLADPDLGITAVAHAGRNGVLVGVAEATVDAMRALGAERLHAWLGPHVCGGCYEVPAELRAEVAAAVPATYACTTWGTPSLDLGAGVRAQLQQREVEVVDVGGCTRETSDLYSYRRDGDRAGRFAGLVVLRRDPHE